MYPKDRQKEKKSTIVRRVNKGDDLTTGTATGCTSRKIHKTLHTRRPTTRSPSPITKSYQIKSSENPHITHLLSGESLANDLGILIHPNLGGGRHLSGTWAAQGSGKFGNRSVHGVVYAIHNESQQKSLLLCIKMMKMMM
jgi:hypothetical protein